MHIRDFCWMSAQRVEQMFQRRKITGAQWDAYRALRRYATQQSGRTGTPTFPTVRSINKELDEQEAKEQRTCDPTNSSNSPCA